MKKLIQVLAFLALMTPAQAQIINTLPFILQNGTVADAAEVMADFNQIVNNVNANAAKNGVNSDITALLGLTTPLTPSQGGSSVYVGATVTGTANAIVIASPVPTGFSLAVGRQVTFVATGTNTTAATLNVNSTGARNIYRLAFGAPAPLIGGEIVAGNLVTVVYDGTQFQLATQIANTFGPLTNLASAGTTDLGTIASHNVNITGNTTITAFGSTATADNPVYRLVFAGSLTLTYNATSLILPGGATIQTAAGDTAEATYLGSGNWRVTDYTRASGANIVATTPLCGASGLVLTNNAGTPNTNIDITASQAVMQNTSGVTITANSVSVTVNTTVTGANGLDTGARANTTWYHLFLISDGTTTAGLASTSATAPTMPGSYTYRCRLGAMKTNGSSNFLRTIQKGARAQYQVVAASTTPNLPIAATGTAGSLTVPTWVSVTVNPDYVPPTAITVSGILGCGASSGQHAMAAPNNAYGAMSSTTNPPAIACFSAGIDTNTAARTPFEFVLESTAVYWANNTSILAITGWVDSVNAN
jgi:hypothetical protein